MNGTQGATTPKAVLWSSCASVHTCLHCTYTHIYAHLCTKKNKNCKKDPVKYHYAIARMKKKTKTPSNTDSNIEDVEFIYF